MIKKIDKALARLTKIKREKMWITEINNETTNPTDIKKIIRKY